MSPPPLFTPPATPTSRLRNNGTSSSRRERCTPPSPSRYRCSRCGHPGHNVRRCPQAVSTHKEIATQRGGRWFQQRCSACGEAGHNARACPDLLRRACPICRGTAKLRCSQCSGSGLADSPCPSPAPVEEPARTVVWLSPEQKKMADAARSRARFFGVAQEGDELVGGESVERIRGVKKKGLSLETRCTRCLGRGYLSCMACSAD